MKPRLLRYLACPEDGCEELALVTSDTGFSRLQKEQCGSSCAVAGGIDGAAQSGKCAECMAVEVHEGTITCADCGASYSVTKGIPRMLPASLVQPREETAQDKANEMRSRDEQATAYDGLKLLNLLTRVEKPLFMKFVDEAGALVELGCGTGRFTPSLAARGREVVALDFSYRSLELCAAKIPGNVHLLQADISRLPLKTGVFDRAASCQVLEHLPSDTARQEAVAEAARVLASGGHLAISAYTYSRLHRMFAEKEGYHPGGIYYNRFTPKEFSELLGTEFSMVKHHKNVGGYVQMASVRKKPTGGPGD